MNKQYRIGFIFETFVTLFGALRLLRASAPMVSIFLVVGIVIPTAAMVSLVFSAHGDTWSDTRQELSIAARSNYSSPFALPSGVESIEPATPTVKLSAEQAKIAIWVSKAYRVAVDDARFYVLEAYKAAKEFKVDPFLVIAVMSIESSFDPEAESQVGAQGLMQVHTRVHQEKFSSFGGPAAAFQPVASIRVGTRILRDYLTRHGSPEAALKSYVGAANLADDGGYGAKVLWQRTRVAAVAAGRVPAGIAEYLLLRAARSTSGKNSVEEQSLDITVERFAKALRSSSGEPVGGSPVDVRAVEPLPVEPKIESSRSEGTPQSAGSPPQAAASL
jgi:Transglycosylase SLT domain